MALGPGRGQVQLGAPLDLVFDLELDPNTNLGDACLSAKVLYGDAQVSLAKTRLTPVPASGAALPQVRVQGPNVQEPVVRVTLTAGCANKVVRQYTFLTELPQPAALSSLPADLPRATPVSANPVVPTGNLAPAESSRAPSATTPRLPRPPRKAVAETGAAPSSRPRLQMEPLESWFAAPTALRSSWSLATLPSEESTPRRLEAAALWKQLNQGPQDLQQAFDRAGALEAEAAKLRTQAQQARAQVQEVQTRLETLERERYPAEWVYGLGASSLAFLGLAAWGWRRSRRQPPVATEPAWHETPIDGADAAQPAGPSEGPVAAAVNTAVGTAAPMAAGASPVAPWPMQPVTNSPWATAPAAVTPQATAGAGFAAGLAPALAVGSPEASGPGLSPAQEAELLFDVRQQAEFFASVGEHDQAIRLLKEHIASHADRSPVAYLDLLQLYHTLGRAEDFRQLRVEFMRHFNAQVPDFSGFNLPSRDLEAYPAILGQIDLAWPTDAVLPLLEAQIFRRTDALTGGNRYELEAFDDLQLLLGIALNTTPAERASTAPRPLASLAMLGEAAPVPAPNAPAKPVSPEAVQAPALGLPSLPDLPFGLHPPSALPLAAAPATTAPAPAASVVPESTSVPMDAVLLPPDEFFSLDLPFAAPPRQAPEPSQPSELTERLRHGSDVDFDDPLLHGFLAPPAPAKPGEATPEGTMDSVDDLAAHRYSGKALDFEPTEQSFNIKK